jgi:hypothetical protein
MTRVVEYSQRNPNVEYGGDRAWALVKFLSAEEAARAARAYTARAFTLPAPGSGVPDITRTLRCTVAP